MLLFYIFILSNTPNKTQMSNDELFSLNTTNKASLGNLLENDEKWPRLRMDQCLAARRVYRENTCRAAMNFKFGAIFSSGLELSGTPHVDGMDDGTKKEFNKVFQKFGKESLYRKDGFGIIFWRFYEHPSFKFVPAHLEPSTTEIRFIRHTDGRVIYHLYDISTLYGQMNTKQARIIKNAFVYEEHAPDMDGNIDSIVSSLIIHYEYFMENRDNTLIAQRQLAKPPVVKEHLPTEYTDEKVSAQTDAYALLRDVKNAVGALTSTSTTTTTTTSSSSAMTVSTLQTGEGSNEPRSATVDPAARALYEAVNSNNPNVVKLLHDPQKMQEMQERAMIKDNTVVIDPGLTLVSNKMISAEAPVNVQEVEISYSQRVYETLGIPRTMATSEGSKTSTNQNSQELFDQTRLDCVNWLEDFLTYVYDTIFKKRDIQLYWKAKSIQYKDMKNTAKKHVKNSRKQRSQRNQNQMKDDNEAADEDDESEGEDENGHSKYDWGQELEDAYDRMFSITCSQQEAIAKTKIHIDITGSKPTEKITEFRAGGYINWEGARYLFQRTTKIPEKYIPKEELVDAMTLAGVGPLDTVEGATAIVGATEKAKSKTAQSKGY